MNIQDSIGPKYLKKYEYKLDALRASLMFFGLMIFSAMLVLHLLFQARHGSDTVGMLIAIVFF